MKDQKIEVPPLPAGLRDVEPEARAYALAAIEADRQRRGEPVAAEYVTTHAASIRSAFETLKNYVSLDEEDDPTYYDHELRALDTALSTIEAPQPAEPMSVAERWQDGDDSNMVSRVDAPAEPVKVPSDAAIQALAKQYDCHQQGFMGFARALLARYGQPAGSAERELRRLLACQYAGATLYRDDGELQDNREIPFIDFLRDSPEQISEKMTERGIAQLAELTVADFQALLALAARIESADGEPIPVSVEAASLIRGMLSRYGQPAQPAASAEPVYQFRKEHCADWYDGLPDHSDGGGPYEVRTLYSAPVAAHPDHSEQDLNMVAAQPSVPEGWRLVPAEPTTEMLTAGAGSGGLGMDYHEWVGRTSLAWRAMLEAAPTPPAGANGGYSREWCMKMAQLEADAGYLDQTILNPPAAGQAQGWDTQVIRDILTERQRQTQIGYDSDHDDDHVIGEIAAMAAFYMLPPAVRDWPATETGYGDTFGEAIIPEGWQASPHHSRRVELVRAVAMGLAEIERIDRAAVPTPPADKEAK